jgi:hypothetical protein
MCRTMPQIVMLNAASRESSKRLDRRMERNKNKQITTDEEDPVVMNGKRLSELDTNSMRSYYSDLG